MLPTRIPSSLNATKDPSGMVMSLLVTIDCLTLRPTEMKAKPTAKISSIPRMILPQYLRISAPRG